ncbi:hypothetical protein [Bdellovibrio svalbardensis]|uniref:Lipoprotein n=1 Tax=Bdellovibrio svalbardensis TaxID=2972972 RepID=A0ABT6DLD6_9BACT|nr:hypothetical protein [Bdellovibrio svalbardensis]MDG0817690.1 hypothetical protein [Bdellovibrio svalbardensis]
MKNWLSFLLVVSSIAMSGCATIVKSEKIPVRFVGGLQEGDTQINMPDGQYNLKNGQTTVLVSRSKEDIPITVTCNQQTREGVIQTKYDAVAGVLGNIVFGGLIGMGIDAYNNKAYDPPSIYNLSPLCHQPGSNPVVDTKETSDKNRSPSSN